MMGYLNKPKSAFFDDDGFGMTGDIGYYNEGGVVFYVDRVKEIIKLVTTVQGLPETITSYRVIHSKCNF